MAKANAPARRTLYAAGVIVAGLIVFVSVNILANLWLTDARLDLTEDQLYTFSDATTEVLAAVDEPIDIRFYKSEAVDELGPFFVDYARRVEELLVEYERRSGGLVNVELYEPEPYSPEEDLAVADGLRGVPVSLDGQQLYFGLAGRNRTDDRQAIPYLAPERASFLEYDLTRLVFDLANPEKPAVGLLGELPMTGDAGTQFQPWIVMEAMQQAFDVRSLTTPIERIEEDIEILMLTQPGELDPATVYAIDQFVMRGGRVLAFLDPLAEVLAAQAPAGAPPTSFDSLAPLLDAWGIEVPVDRVVGDRQHAVRVQATDQGRPVIIDYLPWVSIDPAGMDRNDVVLANLTRLNFNTAGYILPIEDAGTSVQPLVVSSAEAMTIDANVLRFGANPIDLMNDFEASDERFVLAARVVGPVTSAFPEGPPEAVEETRNAAEHRTEAERPLNLIVVADSDLLSDRAWVQSRSVLGQSFAVPTANNGDLAVNALENLSGSDGLIALRGRGLSDRPFEVLEAMRREAEQRYRDTEQQLVARIEETEERIRQLRRQEQEGGVMLTSAQIETIDEFRDEMLALRQELRGVRHALRQDVERVQNAIRVANIWGVPALVALVALGLALLRRRRASRRQALLG